MVFKSFQVEKLSGVRMLCSCCELVMTYSHLLVVYFKTSYLLPILRMHNCVQWTGRFSMSKKFLILCSSNIVVMAHAFLLVIFFKMLYQPLSWEWTMAFYGLEGLTDQINFWRYDFMSCCYDFMFRCYSSYISFLIFIISYKTSYQPNILKNRQSCTVWKG